jgi:two-component system, cell cycle response regulator DivK
MRNHDKVEERRDAMETKPFILVCDDNKSITQLIVFVLQKAGYLAQAVNSALDCVAVARRNRPDVILMDIVMPGMDGATASGLMKDIPELRGVPIILLSAMPQEEVKDRLEEAEVKGYLLKPFRISDLLEIVRISLPDRTPLKQAV